MRIISWPRRAGKTTTMLNLMREDPRITAICHSYEEAARLQRENKDIDPHRFVAYRAVQDGVLLGRNHLLIIDNLELILPRLLGTDDPILLATMSEEV